jgi:3-phenylpropionate/cinnamic acid dioxygenase small subunit
VNGSADRVAHGHPDQTEVIRDLVRRARLDELNQRYADAIDSRRLEDWPAFFTDDGCYSAQSRENSDSGLPLCLLRCEGRAMMEDRVLVIGRVMVFAPRSICHVVSPSRILSTDGDVVCATAAFAVFHTLPHEPTQLLAVGHYRDEVAALDSGAPLFLSRAAIYDSLLIPNSMVYPL